METPVADENIALVAFYEGWEPAGVGPDGLPLFRSVVKIRKSVPPYSEVMRVAEPGEIEQFPVEYRMFLKEIGGRNPDVAGYPLALWPVISPADFQNCAAREIYTVEQLAALASKRANANEIPPPIMELAKRAKKMVELQKEVGKFEVVIDQLTAERDLLAGELKEANATIAAQNMLINQLRPKVA